MSQNVKAFRLPRLPFAFFSSALSDGPFFFAFAFPEIDSTKIADNLLAMRQTKKNKETSKKDKNERN